MTRTLLSALNIVVDIFFFWAPVFSFCYILMCPVLQCVHLACTTSDVTPVLLMPVAGQGSPLKLSTVYWCFNVVLLSEFLLGIAGCCSFNLWRKVCLWVGNLHKDEF